jgi:hypothetical protein
MSPIISAHKKDPLFILLAKANEVESDAMPVLETFEPSPKLTKELRVKIWRLTFEPASLL